MVSPRNRADKNVWKNNNKNSEKETQNSNTSPDNSRGDVIIIKMIRRRNGAKTISSQTWFGNLIRNGANTICLPNFAWGT